MADLNQLGDVPKEYAKVAAELRTLGERPGMIALAGGRGPGKTELACGLAREFCRHGRSARYLRTLELFRKIRATWGAKRGEATEDDVIDELRRVELLVLDEVQVRSDSPWENTILTDLLDARYADNLATLLVANLEPKALQATPGRVDLFPVNGDGARAHLLVAVVPDLGQGSGPRTGWGRSVHAGDGGGKANARPARRTQGQAPGIQ